MNISQKVRADLDKFLREHQYDTSLYIVLHCWEKETDQSQQSIGTINAPGKNSTSGVCFCIFRCCI